MIAHDIVVVGGSAGGVEALLELARGLPAALAANVLVTVHLAASSTSLLPALVARVGPLPARHPADRTPLAHGQIFLAPPDYHLLCTADGVRLGVGPRENGHRPSIDVLFRTAARHFGPRVLGVILSGNLDDGTAGALEVRRCGGSVIAQDPDDSLHPSMPLSAIRAGAVDHVLPLAALAGDIDRLSRGTIPFDDAPRAGRPRPGDPQESGDPPGSEHAAFNPRVVARHERDHNNSGSTRLLDGVGGLETRAETSRARSRRPDTGA